MRDQIIGIGSVSLLVFVSVRLSLAFREGARMARSGQLADLERAVIRVPDLEDETASVA